MRSVAMMLVLLVVLVTPRASESAEARCAELDAQYGAGTCHCSEPLNTATYTTTVSANYRTPSDTTTKKCNLDGFTGTAISEGGSGGFAGWQVFSSGEAITNLPAAHTNTFVLAQKPNVAAGLAMGGQFLSSAPTKLRIARFYRYISSNFAFTDPNQGAGSCLNAAKNFQLGFHGALTGGPLFNRSYGDAESFYDIDTTFAYNMTATNCCVVAPGQGAGANINASGYRGKWMRYEFAYRNADPGDSGPTTFTGWRKNVTDNTPEVVIVDSRIVGGPTGDPITPWPVQFTTNLKVTQRYNDFAQDLFRNGSGCTGYEATAYFIMASFATDTGQRIGAAVEIEGSGTSPAAFSLLSTAGAYGLTGAATTLTRIAGPTQIGFIHTAILLVTIVALLCLWRRTHAARR